MKNWLQEMLIAAARLMVLLVKGLKVLSFIVIFAAAAVILWSYQKFETAAYRQAYVAATGSCDCACNKEASAQVSATAIHEPATVQLSRPLLDGKLYKSLVVPAYNARDFAEAVKLGKFDNEGDLGRLISRWGDEPVGLQESTKIDLIEFDRNWSYDDVLAWGRAHSKRPMVTTHLMGVAIGLPNEQRERPIVELGSVLGGDVIYLDGGSNWRHLNYPSVGDAWLWSFVVGFLGE